MQTPPPMPSPPRDFGWDFFNLFDAMRPDVVSRYTKPTSSYDEDLRLVRQQERIPEIEEETEEDKKVVVVEENPTKGEVSDSRQVEMVKVVDGLGLSNERKSELPEKSRELLEALRDIESHFMRAYDSGKDVCRMLEASNVHLQSGLEDLKGLCFFGVVSPLNYQKTLILTDLSLSCCNLHLAMVQISIWVDPIRAFFEF